MAVKRSLDIAVSGAALALLSPLLLVIAGLIYLQKDGAILFLHERTGLAGKTFVLYKFRSMVSTASAIEPYL